MVAELAEQAALERHLQAKECQLASWRRVPALPADPASRPQRAELADRDSLASEVVAECGRLATIAEGRCRWEAEAAAAESRAVAARRALGVQRDHAVALATELEALRAELAAADRALSDGQRGLTALGAAAAELEERCAAGAAEVRCQREAAAAASEALLVRQTELERCAELAWQHLKELQESVHDLGAQLRTSGCG